MDDTKAIAIRAREFVQQLSVQQAARIAALSKDVSSEYQPTQQSQLVLPTNSEQTQPFIVGDKGNMLASISIAEGGRSGGYGVNVLEQFRTGTNTAHIPAFRRLLSWLVQGNADSVLPKSLNVGWAGLDATKSLAGLTKAEVTAATVNCDFIVDSNCAKEAQLLVVGSNVTANPNLEANIRALVKSGKPILYLHTDSWNDSESGRQMLAGMGLSLGNNGGNYWPADAVAAGRSNATNQTLTAQFTSVMPLLNKLADESYRTDYDWSKCVGNGCSDVPGLQTELLKPSEAFRSQIDEFNRAGRNLFATPNTSLLRYLALWADVTRKQIKYPLDKATQTVAFQKALIADAWVAYVRSKNVAQADLGTFMSNTAATLSTSNTDETVTVALPAESGFTTIGRFAVPGKTLQVTVVDAGKAKLSLRLNTQRTGSTRLWTQDTYNRPRFLASPAMALAQGQAVEVVSPYGGTLQLAFSEATAGQTVQLRLRGVAQHPFLDLSNANNKAAFVAAIQNGQFDWAEIKLPGTEIHTRIDKMKSVLADDYKNDIDRYLDELRTVFFEDAYQLAGFTLPGKSLVTAVQTFCTSHNWDCTSENLHRVPGTQHINVDAYSQCGSGCSGNPYDQDWGLNPRGWGESHELGHNLQQSMLNVYSGRSTEVSNNLFPLHKNWRLLRELSDDRSNDRVAYRSTFDMIKTAKGSADPIESAYQRIWGSEAYAAENGERMAFYLQWIHYWSQRMADETRGWDIVTLLYLHQRQFAQGDWATIKDRLGYSQYATRPSVDGNDNLLITLSLITQRDQRPTFNLWGVRYSAAAASQVTSFGFAAEPALFFANTVTNKHSSVKKVDMGVANPAWPF
ncbi:ImpA family metalloprotease [Chitinimonas sp. BJB300]|uniref:ImpA family metalloprotease n=1 Tax=Chitinimonas sp. BJB300 TaxID=1559339 RepID=UPI000C0F2BDE|nr:ImpA family metalloprotease [Chitinimonas sp. BJB300]PHV10389.1 hypothetical protein CSQ89_16465 [Chitinimonas sp. BJB300]TSJ87523.1 hypothetical protein FG002_013385 [Chitinimonas sp. BJB300]